MPVEQWVRNQLYRLSEWMEKPLAVPLMLSILAFLSYGLLINRLGYYWDDFPLVYIHKIYGSEGLIRYFSTNRPFWGLLYQVTFSLFDQPWQWQLIALFWRWLGAVILWALLRQIWPENKNVPVWISMFFLIYPGFSQQHISVIYSHIFIVLDCFLLSLYINIKTIRIYGTEKFSWRAIPYHVIALILSFYNLLALEYFFALELLRPILIFSALRNSQSSSIKKVNVVIKQLVPYLILWVGVVIWRLFFFGFQTQNYQMRFFQSLREAPLEAILNLFKAIGTSLWQVIVHAWAYVFRFPDLSQLGVRTAAGTVLIIILSLVLTVSFLLMRRESFEDRRKYKIILLVGLVACLLGGVPWWLIEIPPALSFPSDRFTLPFILGVSMIIVGLLVYLPMRRWMRVLFVSILVAFAVGSQFQVTNQFRRDWETQRRFFWQLTWRIPSLENGTTLMVNDLPVTYYSDNSLTAPLNWFWAPSNTSQQMSYLLLYPSQRLGSSLISLNPEIPINVDYLAAKFVGNTSQTVAVFYDPPACLRVLDKLLDSDNRMLPMDMQAAAALSSTEWIRLNETSNDQILPGNLYDPEPVHSWCYYYEMADIARQKDRWEDVASLGDTAYQLNDYPNDPAEHFLFIEGYAHNGDWNRAQELSEQAITVTPLMKPLLCRLWDRIITTTRDSQEKVNITESIYLLLNCE